jgi:hypothetical protein
VPEEARRGAGLRQQERRSHRAGTLEIRRSIPGGAPADAG